MAINQITVAGRHDTEMIALTVLCYL